MYVRRNQNTRSVNNKLTIWISFLNGNKRKKTEFYPQNKESNAKTRATNLPDKLILIPKRTARTPRRRRTPPRLYQSSYTPMSLNFPKNLPQNRTRRYEAAMVSSLRDVASRKKAQLMRRPSAAPRGADILFQGVDPTHVQKHIAPPLIFVLGTCVKPSSHYLSTYTMKEKLARGSGIMHDDQFGNH